MFRVVSPRYLRLLTILSCGLLCLLASVDSSRAAGCHTDDHAVLGGALSWDIDVLADPAAQYIAPVPPVIARTPCHGETPHVVDSTGHCVDACLTQACPTAVVAGSDEIWFQLVLECTRAPLLRLDRPPRTA